jgi:biopolymer transport protein ExbB
MTLRSVARGFFRRYSALAVDARGRTLAGNAMHRARARWSGTRSRLASALDARPHRVARTRDAVAGGSPPRVRVCARRRRRAVVVVVAPSSSRRRGPLAWSSPSSPDRHDSRGDVTRLSRAGHAPAKRPRYRQCVPSARRPGRARAARRPRVALEPEGSNMHGFSLIHLFTRFAMLGAEWVMWLLIALSVASIAVMVERARYLRSLRDDLGALADQLNRLLRDDDEVGARELLRNSPSPAALVALDGLNESALGAETAEKVMASTQARAKQQLERNLTFLSTVGNNAPFVGLFGTVIGIIQAFDALKPPPGIRGAAAAAQAAAATGRVMGTIAEALVATAIGLLVAIPAVASYNYFQRSIKNMLASTETLSQLVLAYVHRQHRNDGIKDLVQLLRGDRAPSVAPPAGAPPPVDAASIREPAGAVS